MAHLHHHHHESGSDSDASRSVGNITIAFLLNIFFTGVEVVGGLLTGSLAILSDALHDLGDSFALGIAYALERLSGKKRTPLYSYGFRRYSLLSALINSMILLSGSIVILIEAIPRLSHPVPVKASGVIALALLGIAVNGFAAFRMKGSHKLSERTVMLHLVEDVLGWVAVLIGSIVMIITSFPVIDPILSIIITIYVLVRGLTNLARTMRIFLQAVPPGLDIDSIVTHVKGMPPITDVHDVHAWTLDGEYNIATLHVVVPDDFPIDKVFGLRKQVRAYLMDNRIQHATIEIGREGEDCELSDC